MICNLFKHNTNTYAALRHTDVVVSLLTPYLDTANAEVLANLILDYSVAIYQQPGAAKNAHLLCSLVNTYLQTQRSNECVAKVVTAIGNLTLCSDSELAR